MKKKSKKKDKKKEDKEKLNVKNPNNLSNNSKIDTSKGGLIPSPSMAGFNKLNNSGMTIKKGTNITNTNVSLNSNITTSNSQKNLTINDKKLDKKEELDDNAVTTDIILDKTQNKEKNGRNNKNSCKFGGWLKLKMYRIY